MLYGHAMRAQGSNTAGVYTFHCMRGRLKGGHARFCLHRHNEVTQEVTSLVDELKSVPPKDRKKVP